MKWVALVLALLLIEAYWRLYHSNRLFQRARQALEQSRQFLDGQGSRIANLKRQVEDLSTAWETRSGASPSRPWTQPTGSWSPSPSLSHSWSPSPSPSPSPAEDDWPLCPSCGERRRDGACACQGVKP